MKNFLTRIENFLTRIACAVIGYNYDILKSCSEGSRKALKKYFSAIILISILWGLIGFNFYKRYVHGDNLSSLVAGLVMVVAIIMIERQIILTVQKNWLGFIFRGLIGVVMALIGSVIIDQILFKDDVEKKMIRKIEAEVDTLLSYRVKEIESQISQRYVLISSREKERDEILKQSPYEELRQSKITRDSTGRVLATETGKEFKENLRYKILPDIESSIIAARKEIDSLENKKLSLRTDLKSEIEKRTGLLEEISVLILEIVASSWITILLYCVIFFFLFSIELLVIFIKLTDTESDYDSTISYQQDMRKGILENWYRTGLPKQNMFSSNEDMKRI